MLFPVRQGILGSCWDFGPSLSSQLVPKQHLLGLFSGQETDLGPGVLERPVLV